MPIPQTPDFLPQVLGQNADIFDIPLSASTTDPAAAGTLNYATGWPQITAIAPEAGGLAPEREYFNAVNKLFSQHLFFQQSGGVYPWNAGLNYLAGAHVLGSDGNEYVAQAPSGPDVPAAGGSGVVGPVDPVNDTTGAWGKTVLNPTLLLPTYPGEVLTTSGTWTAPESRYYWITLVGGGGGGSGGYATAASACSGAGGGSGYVRQFVRWYGAGTQVAYIVGAGGSGGKGGNSSNAGNGGNGGDTAFDGIIAPGGNGATGAYPSGGSFVISSAGIGRINGGMPRYGLASGNINVQFPPAAGYSDLSAGKTAYGTGGIGGNAQTTGGVSDGTIGYSGAVIIR